MLFHYALFLHINVHTHILKIIYIQVNVALQEITNNNQENL